MPAVHAEVPVLIVGGGPVGLTARALLERWGVRALHNWASYSASPTPPPWSSPRTAAHPSHATRRRVGARWSEGPPAGFALRRALTAITGSRP